MNRLTLFVDIDDTLLMHDLSKYSFLKDYQYITIKHGGREFKGYINLSTIKKMTKFYKLGYDIYIWSKTGRVYAEAVAIQLSNLLPPITGIMSKPTYYLDDKDVTEWMGERLIPIS